MYALGQKIYIEFVFLPDKLKLGDICLIYKALGSTGKRNYRPVSISNSIFK